MRISAPVLGGRLRVDLPGASINLVMSTSDEVGVITEASVTLDKMWLKRGRIIRWTNTTTQRSGGGNSVSNTGAAYASGGSFANTGIVDIAAPTAPNGGVVTIEVPVEVWRITVKNAASLTIDGGLRPFVRDKR